MVLTHTQTALNQTFHQSDSPALNLSQVLLKSSDFLTHIQKPRFKKHPTIQWRKLIAGFNLEISFNCPDAIQKLLSYQKMSD